MSKPPSYQIHRKLSRKRLKFALFTVSSSRYRLKLRGESFKDESMETARKIVVRAGHSVVQTNVLDDNLEMIRETLLKSLKQDNLDVIIFIGGTGLTKRDVTIEAVKPLFEKEAEGFGELFRLLSYKEIGPASALSRATAGVASGKAVLCLPGSPNAVKLALEMFIDELPHMVFLARS